MATIGPGSRQSNNPTSLDYNKADDQKITDPTQPSVKERTGASSGASPGSRTSSLFSYSPETSDTGGLGAPSADNSDRASNLLGTSSSTRTRTASTTSSLTTDQIADIKAQRAEIQGVSDAIAAAQEAIKGWAEEINETKELMKEKLKEAASLEKELAKIEAQIEDQYIDKCGTKWDVPPDCAAAAKINELEGVRDGLKSQINDLKGLDDNGNAIANPPAGSIEGMKALIEDRSTKIKAKHAEIDTKLTEAKAKSAAMKNRQSELEEAGETKYAAEYLKLFGESTKNEKGAAAAILKAQAGEDSAAEAVRWYDALETLHDALAELDDVRSETANGQIDAFGATFDAAVA